MSPAPATRGTSEKFSGNWVKKKLTRGRLHTVTPPPARSLGSAATRTELGEPGLLGVPAAGRGRGAGNLRLSPPSPGPRYGTQSGTRLGCPCPRARSGWRRAEGRGQRGSVTCAGRPLPKVPSSPARSPSVVTCESGTIQGHRRDPRPSQGRPPHRDPVLARPAAVGPAVPGSARPAAAAAAGDCLRGPARRSALVVSGKLRGWPR